MDVAARSILAAFPVNLITMALDLKDLCEEILILAVSFRDSCCRSSQGISVPGGGRDREGAGQCGSHYTDQPSQPCTELC